MMLTIRKDQDQVFRTLYEQRFRQRMVIHLRHYFPNRCRALDEDEINGFIERAVETAAKYGFYTERNVCKFADLMLYFGEDFHQAPRYPWATEVLEDNLYPSPQAKMAALFARAKLQPPPEYKTESDNG